MNLFAMHDFYVVWETGERVERGWWVCYFGGLSACTWLVPGTLDPSLEG